MNSPELAAHLKTWEQDYPLAPGYTLKPLIDSYATTKNTQDTAGGFRDSVFFYSECTWVDYWVTSDRTGKAAAKREATRGLATTVAKLDSPARINLDETGRRFLTELVEAAEDITRRVAAPEEAADLFGEVLVVLWRRRNELPPAGRDRLWLFVVARNVLANHQRRAVRHRHETTALADQLKSVLAEPPDLARTLDLHTALDNLPSLDREIIQLFIWEGFTSSEIGARLDIPADTVRSRLRRIRTRLRHDLNLAENHQDVR